MSSVIFDYTRILSAFAMGERHPRLFLSDLAKTVEAIVLYDEIFELEGVEGYYQRHWIHQKDGLFDLSKDYVYEPIFDVFRVPPSSGEAERLLDDGPRRSFLGRNYLECDLDLLQDAKRAVSAEDFQLVGSTSFSDSSLLTTLTATRVKLTVASEQRAPYDPVEFRVPLVELLLPSNVFSQQIALYRKFEDRLRDYLNDECGGLKLPVPLILASVLSECKSGNPDDVFACAIQLRNDPLMIRLRSVLHEYTEACQGLQVQTISKLNRIMAEELDRLVAKLSGDFTSSLQFQLKPGWFPLEMSFDLKRTINRFREPDAYLGLGNVSRMSLRTLQSFPDISRKVESVLGVRWDGKNWEWSH